MSSTKRKHDSLTGTDTSAPPSPATKAKVSPAPAAPSTTAIAAAKPADVPFHIGHQGAAFIRHALSQSHPGKVITEFQAHNGLGVPGVAHSVALLDLLGLRRRETYEFVLRRTCARMMEKIETMNEEKLHVLLESSFSYISMEELRAIPVKVMQRLHPTIPKGYLTYLAQKPKLIDALPIELRRAVYTADSKAAEERFQPIVAVYVADPARNMAALEMLTRDTGNSGLSLKRRREQDTTLVALVDFMGTSKQLYAQIVQYLRTQYIATADRAYCTLRYELLMYLHDSGRIPDMTELDPVHTWAWCLDAGLRDGVYEVKIIETLSGFIRALPVKSPLHVDIMMLCCNPPVTYTILHSIISALNDTVEQEAIPKDHPTLRFLTDLLTYSTRCHAILESSPVQPGLPTAHTDVISVFYPLLAELILLSQLEEAEPINDKIPPFFEIATTRQLLCYYLLTRLRARDIDRVTVLLPLTQSLTAVQWTEQPQRAFLHTLVTELIAVKDVLNTHTALVQMVLEQMLVAHAPDSSLTMYETLRALTSTADVLGVDAVTRYVSTLQSTSSQQQQSTSDSPTLVTSEQLSAAWKTLRSSCPAAFAKSKLDPITKRTTAASAEHSG